MRKDKQPLEEYKVNIRIVLSAFWTAIMFCYLYGDYFELYVPNKVAGLISGDNLLDSPMKLFDDAGECENTFYPVKADFLHFR